MERRKENKMKNLIVLTTKYGTSEVCAQEIAKKLTGTTDIVNIRVQRDVELSDYDCVIIGGSIYIGSVHKELKKFCNKNLNTLLEKQVGLYICCMRDQEAAEKELNGAFPKALVEHATVKDYFGGKITNKKLSFVHRMITKMVVKADKTFPSLDEEKNVDTINHEKIDHFVNVLK